MAQKITFVALALGGLAACGGGATSSAIPSSLNAVSSAPDTVTASYNSGADVYTIFVDGTSDNAPGVVDATDFLAGNPALDLTSFDRSDNPISGTSMYSSIGDNSAVNLIFGDDGGTFFRAAQFERTTNGPVSGSDVLEYSGDYIGILTNGITDNVQNFIDGDVMLTIDLNEAEVSGSITNRLVREPINLAPNIALSPNDVTLEASPIGTNGIFSGTTTGGAILVNANDGTFQGLIAGPDLDEAVGTVSIRHSNLFTFTNETGIFAAGH